MEMADPAGYSMLESLGYDYDSSLRVGRRFESRDWDLVAIGKRRVLMYKYFPLRSFAPNCRQCDIGEKM
jgi:hypothetical protein